MPKKDLEREKIFRRATKKDQISLYFNSYSLTVILLFSLLQETEGIVAELGSVAGLAALEPARDRTCKANASSPSSPVAIGESHKPAPRLLEQ